MKKMTSAIIFSLAALVAMTTLTGCNMLNTKKDTREWVEVTCSGSSDWSKCYEKAAKICPSGYDIGYKEESAITLKRQLQFACKS
ncbi:MAG TPA: hypothetical protein VK974_12995 [Methylophilaceae bacterium]|nr:hypothetical protein [Methylophilaceae bacterium]